MPASPSRVFISPVGHIADGNAYIHHPAEKGAWIWHPDLSVTQTAFLRFRLRFTLAQGAEPLLHVTADQRFQLRCDGRDVTFGPDRCDPEHWTVQTIRLPLAAGEHELEALVWSIKEPEGAAFRGDPSVDEKPSAACPPMAQMSWRNGFLLYAEGVESSLLTTGKAPWMVEDITDAVEMFRFTISHYLDVGPGFVYDLKRWSARNAKPAKVVMRPLTENRFGLRRPGWCLYPAVLPEQRREPWTGGRIRAYRDSLDDAPVKPEETRAPEIAAWQDLVAKNKALTIPAHSSVTVLWDLEIYQCGYPVMKTEGGAGAVIEWSWAEALYEAPSVKEITGETLKGHRGEVENKVFLGTEDRWRISGEKSDATPALWWRCGRYVRVRVTTADAPLTLAYLGLLTTGYPLDLAGSWKSSDASWDRLMPLFENAYRIGAHETWTDTPYYEQMCYVGDNLFNAVSNYAWFGDARLSRRSIQLYEWSRKVTGLVAERYPSDWRQECSTFCLLWPIMVRDYAWWRDDATFIKTMLPGLRSVHAEFESLVHEDGLLHNVPGWPFVDWVPEWSGGAGCGPGVREGDSSLVNLYWVLSLLATAQIEEAFGDPLFAERHRKTARRAFDLIIERYWDKERGLLLDTRGDKAASEHAQMFALLTGFLDQEKTKGCLAALRKGEGLAKATISSSYYALEALTLHRDEAEFHRRLDYWRSLPDQGFTSTPEAPEPTRSDSHPWGAHPAYHTLAGIAGVRPDAPGFARVKIAPLPGKLDHFDAKVVHPRGAVEVHFHRPKDSPAEFQITLPEGVAGTLAFGGQSFDLQPGKNQTTVQ